MRRFLTLPLLALTLAAPLAAQAPVISLIRQPKATLAEFTVPFTTVDVETNKESVHFHVGAGLGLRRWNGGDTAVRIVADANAFVEDVVFLGAAAILEFPEGESAYIGPRIRMGRAFSKHVALTLEFEHLERPFGSGFEPRRRSSLGLALTFRF